MPAVAGWHTSSEDSRTSWLALEPTAAAVAIEQPAVPSALLFQRQHLRNLMPRPLEVQTPSQQVEPEQLQAVPLVALAGRPFPQL